MYHSFCLDSKTVLGPEVANQNTETLTKTVALLDDNDESPRELLGEIVEEALKTPPKGDPDEPRPPTWLKWMEFGALIIGPAIFLGLAFAFGDYLAQFSGHGRYQQELVEKRVEYDTMAAFKLRFIIGAGVGAALGVVYVVRCIIRKVDP